ncbi:MAG: LysR family transcriptional regulator [Eubacteriales bacterium]
MTLLQLKYIVTVAAAGTISEAAKQLYIAQPSLTSAIKELENELGCIFDVPIKHPAFGGGRIFRICPSSD